jgi:predicted KAP-like P-loop ATPase
MTKVTAVKIDGLKFKTAGGYFTPRGWGLRDEEGKFFAITDDNYPFVISKKNLAMELAADGLNAGYKTAVST